MNLESYNLFSFFSYLFRLYDSLCLENRSVSRRTLHHLSRLCRFIQTLLWIVRTHPDSVKTHSDCIKSQAQGRTEERGCDRLPQKFHNISFSWKIKGPQVINLRLLRYFCQLFQIVKKHLKFFRTYRSRYWGLSSAKILPPNHLSLIRS